MTQRDVRKLCDEKAPEIAQMMREGWSMSYAAAKVLGVTGAKYTRYLRFIPEIKKLADAKNNNETLSLYK